MTVQHHKRSDVLLGLTSVPVTSRASSVLFNAQTWEWYQFHFAGLYPKMSNYSSNVFRYVSCMKSFGPAERPVSRMFLQRTRLVSCQRIWMNSLFGEEKKNAQMSTKFQSEKAVKTSWLWAASLFLPDNTAPQPVTQTRTVLLSQLLLSTVCNIVILLYVVLLSLLDDPPLDHLPAICSLCSFFIPGFLPPASVPPSPSFCFPLKHSNVLLVA